MLKDFEKNILKHTGASSYKELETLQNLWSGYGRIVRLSLEGSSLKSVIVKYICLPNEQQHPRGWNTDFSHQRKLKSYEVEAAWYLEWSQFASEDCKMPKCYTIARHGDEVLMVLEDLDAVGYSGRITEASFENISSCLQWLAHFHATYMNKKSDLLWETGTYWHLETRPDEFAALRDVALIEAAPKLDLLLKKSPYQTFVHGDAKLANFCFSHNSKAVAAVDFQYVGAGCGMKDVAYFIGSCLHESDCEFYESDLLEIYFKTLRTALELSHPEIDCDSLEQNWRMLYPIAWSDFHRFLKGWSPGHWKLNRYSENMLKKALELL